MMRKTGNACGLCIPIGFLTFSIVIAVNSYASQLELPNVSGISRDLTGNLSVDQFFSLWIVFNDDQVAISDKPFTVLSPKNQPSDVIDRLLSHPDKVKEILIDHIVLGQKLRLDDISGAFHFRTHGGKIVSVQEINGTLYANNAKVIRPRMDVPGGGVVVVLDDYLFPTEVVETETETGATTLSISLTTEGPTLVPTTSVMMESSSVGDPTNSTFYQNLVDLLSFFKNGVRVFQHFLSKSNVSHILKNDEEYTVLIPTDHAFQRWHPIDWGFYPFSVPEFTETIITNHFISQNLRQDNIKDGQVVRTLGGREIVFTRNLFFLSANGAPIVRGDTPIHHGNLMFISEVLFVNEAEVQKLHQKNKDKETPPLLAFPWFGAQFLSHAFLALERQRKFSHITRFLNLADLAPYVSGKGYTFFVPTDEAFEQLGLSQVPDNYLSAGEGLNILLNHFVKGRLYERDLKNGTELTTLGNKTIHVTNTTEGLYINNAKIVESEVFVYNLGTMFYVDKVLFVDKDSLPPVKEQTLCDNSATTQAATVKPEVERIPEELSEELGTLPDVLLEDDGSKLTNPGMTMTTESAASEKVATGQPDRTETPPSSEEFKAETQQLTQPQETYKEESTQRPNNIK